MNSHVLSAIFRRNFVSYFTTPNGYVFICLFAFASSTAAFMSHAFFNANLANLDQLNEWFPWIMLVFAPTITMSVWADERRQGTDELLLTIPASDLDVVLGKYLAVVAIYTVSLLFALMSHLLMLTMMGNPDVGLFLCNYFGYWLVGVAMLAIGVVASFLTGNVTVAYILGVLFNLPLVLAKLADVLVAKADWVPNINRWSIPFRLADFGRGVISLSSLVYFLSIAALMIYLCLILIGRRHWMGGRDGRSLIGHYGLRAVGLLLAAAGLVLLVSRHDLRGDATVNRTNTLSRGTHDMLGKLFDEELKKVDEDRKKLAEQKKGLAATPAQKEPAKTEPAKTDPAKPDAAKPAPAKTDVPKTDPAKLDKELEALDRREKFYKQRPILVEAYISPDVPEAYGAKRLELLAKLREFESLGRGRLVVKVHEPDLFDPVTETAEKKYGIKPRSVVFRSHGAYSQQKVLMGAAFVHGTNREVVKFFDLGAPVEYELLRSIAAVARQEKKTLGVIETIDPGMARVFGPRDQGLLGELDKVYKVEMVNPAAKIEMVDPKDPDQRPKYAALLVVQPSQLGPPELENVLAAIRTGVPTAIFEDPMPLPGWSDVPGTDQPRRPPQNPMMPFMMGGQQDLPKGEINRLWELLGVSLQTRKFADQGGDGSPLARLRNLGGEENILVWQDFNPYRQLRSGRQLTNGFLFLRDTGSAGSGSFDGADPATAGMFELLFIYPGAIEAKRGQAASLTIKKLVQTSTHAGWCRYKDVTRVFQEASGGPFGGEETDESELPFEMRTVEKVDANAENYCLAVRITGKPAPDMFAGADPNAPKPNPAAAKDLNVVLVSDIDMLNHRFVRLRATPDPDTQNQFQFQNVPFVLNLIDSLTKDERFSDIRKRREQRGTLTRFETQANEIRQREDKIIRDAADEFNTSRTAAEAQRESTQKKWEKDIDEVKATGNHGKLLEAQVKRELESDLATVKELQEKQAARKKRNKALEQAESNREQATRELESRYKIAAVLIPPAPPLIVGLFVFLYRRSREKEGVARSRLR